MSPGAPPEAIAGHARRPAPEGTDAPAHPGDARVRAWVVAGVVAGAVVRLWILRSALGVLDSDEAVVGLMARHALRGELHAFFWDQPYGGTLESLLTAPVFVVLGPSVFALKLVTVVLSGVCALLVWRTGLRTVGPRAALVAALAFWLWPAPYLWWATKARLFYWSTMALGLVILLLALRLAERPSRWADYAALGLAAGLGWWATPQIAYYLLPAVAWLAIRNRKALLRLPLAAPTALLGAAPWVVSNLRHSFASLDPPPPAVADHGYLDHVRILFTKGFPMALGLRVAYTEEWLGAALGVGLYLVGLGGAAYVVGRRRRGAEPVLVALALFPLLYAVSPLSAYVGEGRYVFFVSPFLALLLGHAVRGRRTVAVTFAVLLVLSGWGLAAMRDGNSPYGPDKPVPIAMGPLIRSLEGHGARAVFADYWVAYRLAFESRERITATPVVASRYPPYEQRVRASPRPAYVFVARSATEAPFAQALARLGVRARRLTPKGFVVYLLDRPVAPEQVPLAPPAPAEAAQVPLAPPASREAAPASTGGSHRPWGAVPLAAAA